MPARGSALYASCGDCLSRRPELDTTALTIMGSRTSCPPFGTLALVQDLLAYSLDREPPRSRAALRRGGGSCRHPLDGRQGCPERSLAGAPRRPAGEVVNPVQIAV